VAAAEAMLKVEREVLGRDSPDAAGSLETLAKLHEARGDWAAVSEARREASRIIDARRGAGHWEAIDARWALARAEAVARLDREGRRRFAAAEALDAKVIELFNAGKAAEAV